MALLDQDEPSAINERSSDLGMIYVSQAENLPNTETKKSLADDPWQDLLGDEV